MADSRCNPGATDSGRKVPLPGCLHPHSKTGGYRWKLPGRLVPEHISGGKKTVQIRLIPTGRSKPTRSRLVAERIARRLWRTWRGPGPAARRTMEDLLGEFSRWNLQTASPQSVRNNLGKIRRFLRERGVADPDQITRGEVQAFLISLREGGSAPRTQLKYRSAISKFARWLVQQELLEVNPADGAQVQRAAARVPRYVPWASRARLLRRIMASDQPWMADAVRFALLTGARLGTIRDLRLGETPPAGATVVAVRSLKTGRACYVPVSEALELLFRKWRARLAAGQAASARVFPRHDRRSWGLWFSRLALGLEGFGQGASTGRWWHALRSTFAVRMAARHPATGRPASPWELMAMMGHQSPEVTIGYVQVARAAGLLRT